LFLKECEWIFNNSNPKKSIKIFESMGLKKGIGQLFRIDSKLIIRR